MAASRSIKIELIGYSPAIILFLKLGSGNFSPFHVKRKPSVFSLQEVLFDSLLGLIKDKDRVIFAG